MNIIEIRFLLAVNLFDYSFLIRLNGFIVWICTLELFFINTLFKQLGYLYTCENYMGHRIYGTMSPRRIGLPGIARWFYNFTKRKEFIKK